MCRELNREPAWVAAIKLALTQGVVDVEGVMEEANLVAGRERTVEDVLSTMARRDLLREASGDAPDRYFVGPVLASSAPAPASVSKLSSDAVHRWKREA